MFYDDDADLHKLDGKTVAIIGYGSQGHAHALNLKDSGVDVVVGLRPQSASVAKAEANGLRVTDPGSASAEGDIVALLAPDELHAQIWEAGVGDVLSSRRQDADPLYRGEALQERRDRERLAAGGREQRAQ